MEMKSKKSLIAVLIVVILLFCGGGYYVKENVLFGNDKKAYEYICKAAPNFKNPGSVRLVSGSFVLDTYLACGISATNGFGARSTGYYWIFGGGSIVEEDNPDQDYKKTDELNIKKINKKLEKELQYSY